MSRTSVFYVEELTFLARGDGAFSFESRGKEKVLPILMEMGAREDSSLTTGLNIFFQFFLSIRKYSCFASFSYFCLVAQTISNRPNTLTGLSNHFLSPPISLGALGKLTGKGRYSGTLPPFNLFQGNCVVDCSVEGCPVVNCREMPFQL